MPVVAHIQGEHVANQLNHCPYSCLVPRRFNSKRPVNAPSTMSRQCRARQKMPPRQELPASAENELAARDHQHDAEQFHKRGLRQTDAGGRADERTRRDGAGVKRQLSR